MSGLFEFEIFLAVRRIGAIFVKELRQLRRDRLTFATMLAIPLILLMLFGYAINTIPRDLPTAVLLQETSDVGRSILAAIENTKYFKITHRVRDREQFEQVLRSGEVQFAIEIPAGFERALRRGDRPALLIVADATDPVAAGTALSALASIKDTALINDRSIPDANAGPFEIRQHARYNPGAVTRLNIVPGLLGLILMITMQTYAALSVTREVERDTIENLLSLPTSPIEIMVGKISPYIFVGLLQAALILVAGVWLFGVPVMGDLGSLGALTTLFIATNLSIGYTFSTLAKTQMQAVQLTVMYFLPNILMSGFAFPYDGMPTWAKWIAETLPLTHFVRISRGILLKGATVVDLRMETIWLCGLMLVAMTAAAARFRQTLD